MAFAPRMMMISTGSGITAACYLNTMDDRLIVPVSGLETATVLRSDSHEALYLFRAISLDCFCLPCPGDAFPGGAFSCAAGRRMACPGLLGFAERIKDLFFSFALGLRFASTRSLIRSALCVALR